MIPSFPFLMPLSEDASDVPPPHDLPKTLGSLTLRMAPEEFLKVLPQFQVDLAKILGIEPDDVQIVSVEKVDNLPPAE